MFVSQVDIEEFRGIRRCKKPLELSKFTVLVGRNNSGKSSVLEALSLLPRPKSVLYPWGMKRGLFLVKLHGGRDSLVYGYSGKARIRYTINGSTWVLDLIGPENMSLKVDGKVVDDIADADLASLLKIDKDDLKNCVFFLPHIYGEMTIALDKELRNLKNQIVKSEANTKVAREVSKCVDDEYTEVLWEERALSLRKEFPDRGPLYINIDDLGDGLKKAVRIMLLLEVMQPKLILWDDFEASAHPSLVKMLLEWLNGKDWQVVIATHSIDVLYGLLEVGLKDTTVLQLKKSPQDELICEKLTLDELEDIIYANQDPRLLVDSLRL